jgi:ankyrin repeat protein
MLQKMMNKSDGVVADKGWTRNTVESERGNLEEVERAVKAKADLNAYESEKYCGDHMTLLLWACKNGYEDAVRKLLGQGVNAKLGTKKYGYGPLQIAFGCGFTHIVEVLLAHVQRELTEPEVEQILYQDDEPEVKGRKKAGTRVNRRGGVDEDS